MHRIIDGQVVEMTAEEIAEFEAESAANAEKIARKQYKSQRRDAYGSFGDQLDMIYKEGLDAWKAHVDAVKAKYPKPQE